MKWKLKKERKNFTPGPHLNRVNQIQSRTLYQLSYFDKGILAKNRHLPISKEPQQGFKKKLDTSKLAKFWFWPILKNESLNLVITHSIFHLHSPQFLIWEFSNHSVGYMYKLSNLIFLSLLLTIFSLWIWYLNNSCN